MKSLGDVQLLESAKIGSVINESASLAKKSQAWLKLEDYCARADGSTRGLSGQEIAEFVRLYRQASADLSALTSETSNPELVAWLNALVARAYGILHRTPRRPFPRVLAHSLWKAADVMRRRSRPVWLAFGLFLFSVSAAAFLARSVPGAAEQMVPSGWESVVESWKSGTHDQRTAGESSMASAFYAVNNPRVALVYNGLSVVTFGVFGVYAMWMNGSLFGALALETASVGHLDFLLISVGPHGVSELWGIFIATGAGFVLAGAAIRPGRMTRGEAIREAGKDAFVMLVLSLIMILLAAPIEGWFSFNPMVPDAAKIAFTAVALIAWSGYFIGYGKDLNEETFAALD